ncbi:MAG: alpha/beta fold hydrolase [Rhodospirillales bacterium]
MTTPAHQTGRVKSGDVNVFYRKFGKPGGTPVIIFHGANYYDSHDWIEVADALAKDREVLAWDTRGFGETGNSPSKDYSHDALMGDVVALLDHFGWNKVVAMGHSMGGGNSIVFSARFPKRVQALIIVDHCPVAGPATPKPPVQSINNRVPVFATVEAAQKEMSRDSDTPPGSPKRARLEMLLKKVDGGYTFPRDPDYANRIAVGRDASSLKILPGDMWAELAKVQVPIILVRGTRSDRYDDAKLNRMRTEFPHVEIVDVDSGHDVANGAPQALIAAASSFLARKVDAKSAAE